MRELLEHLGVPARSRNRADCSLCRGHSPGTLSYTDELWPCFRCGRGGNVFTLIQDVHSVKFPAALKHLAQLASARATSQTPLGRSTQGKPGGKAHQAGPDRLPHDKARKFAHVALARQNFDPTLSAFPDELKPLRQWVVWAFEARQSNSGQRKITKVPTQALKHRLTACAPKLADNLSRFSKKAAHGLERKAVR